MILVKLPDAAAEVSFFERRECRPSGSLTYFGNNDIEKAVLTNTLYIDEDCKSFLDEELLRELDTNLVAPAGVPMMMSHTLAMVC